MRRVGYIILMLLMIVTVAHAQPGKRMERVRAIKVAYITDKLQLSAEQSEKFWPVYNQFEEERFALWRKYRRSEGHAAQTHEESIRSIDEDIEMQEKMLELRKKYKDQFLKVITPNQLAALVDAEREFKKMLLQQLKDRRENGERRLR
ncbi:MAG: hypothetical protein JNK00_01220 [Flavipsychrobacter sp.]|nr:hypothetical protein [Flavipsychrobacter sp.]